MEIAKVTNLLLRFLLELCILAAVGFWGVKAGSQTAIKIGLGVGTPLLFALVWGIFMAPASSSRLQEPWLLIAELIIFGLAIVALYQAGQPTLAGVFGLVYLINKVFMVIWRQ